MPISLTFHYFLKRKVVGITFDLGYTCESVLHMWPSAGSQQKSFNTTISDHIMLKRASEYPFSVIFFSLKRKKNVTWFSLDTLLAVGRQYALEHSPLKRHQLLFNLSFPSWVSDLIGYFCYKLLKTYLLNSFIPSFISKY